MIEIIMEWNAAKDLAMENLYSPSTPACRPVDRTQCSECALSAECLRDKSSNAVSWALVLLVSLVLIGLLGALFH